MIDNIPLGRLATESDIATAVVYLASKEIVEREKCDPFGCKTEILKVPVLDEKGNRTKINKWVGWQNYKNILKFEELNSIIKNNGYSWSAIQSIDFYQALRFTITFTVLTV